MYKDLLEFLVKNLVKFPEQISIEETTQDGKIVLNLKVAKEDMGRVIGKQGRIIKSIRQIMYACSNKNGEKVSIEVEEIAE